MKRLKFTIDYNGSNYAGWQKQPNQPTVQSTIELELNKLLGLNESIVGCGRTDSGVHGKNYVFHADVKRVHDQILYKLNRMLPSDIKICKVEEVDQDFHARFNASSRAYDYLISFEKNVFNGDSFYYQYEQNLNLDILNDLQKDFLKANNFQYFKKEHGSSKTDNCNLMSFQWTRVGERQFKFHIKGNRFLRGMVRLIVGAQLNYHRGSLTYHQLLQALNGEQAIEQPWSVPAQGLYFVGATY